MASPRPAPASCSTIAGCRVTVDFSGIRRADRRGELVTTLNDRLAEAGLSVEARPAGHLGIDIVARGVDKSLALSRLLTPLSPRGGTTYRLTMPDGQVAGDWDGIEVWGDQFSPPTSTPICALLAALPPGVRSRQLRTSGRPSRPPHRADARPRRSARLPGQE